MQLHQSPATSPKCAAAAPPEPVRKQWLVAVLLLRTGVIPAFWFMEKVRLGRRAKQEHLIHRLNTSKRRAYVGSGNNHAPDQAPTSGCDTRAARSKAGSNRVRSQGGQNKEDTKFVADGPLHHRVIADALPAQNQKANFRTSFPP